jgi:two-component system sensor histidine kinase MtrB
MGPEGHPHHADLCAAALRAAEAELARALAAKDELLARVSHELRTPLTVVAGFGQALLEHGEQLDADVREECLRAIVRSAWHLEHLISELLDAARLDDGIAVPRPRDVSVGELVSAALGAARWRHPAVVTDGVGLAVYADPSQLTSALLHLLVNAERYGAPPVTVSARELHDGHVEIHVEDEGPGVPEAFVPRLFGRFEQASTGDRRESSGVGLGLYLVRTLVETNHGTVEYARGDAGGARFVLRLPAGVRPEMTGGRRPVGGTSSDRDAPPRGAAAHGTITAPSTPAPSERP